MDRNERAQQYRNKAKQVRVIAESMNATEGKELLMRVVADYLMLARHEQAGEGGGEYQAHGISLMHLYAIPKGDRQHRLADGICNLDCAIG